MSIRLPCRRVIRAYACGAACTQAHKNRHLVGAEEWAHVWFPGHLIIPPMGKILILFCHG